MHKLMLHGKLGKDFGKEHKFEGKTPASIIYGMAIQNKEFSNWDKDEKYKVVIKSKDDKYNTMQVSKLAMRMKLRVRDEIHLIPSVNQSVSLRTIVGITLLAIGFYYAAPGTLGGSFAWKTPLLGGFTTAGGVALWGGILLLGSITGFFDPQDQKTSDSPDNVPSFLFSGSVNKTRSGVAVPIIYGIVRTGSVLVSSQIKTADYEGKIN